MSKGREGEQEKNIRDITSYLNLAEVLNQYDFASVLNLNNDKRKELEDKMNKLNNAINDMLNDQMWEKSEWQKPNINNPEKKKETNISDILNHLITQTKITESVAIKLNDDLKTQNFSFNPSNVNITKKQKELKPQSKESKQANLCKNVKKNNDDDCKNITNIDQCVQGKNSDCCFREEKDKFRERRKYGVGENYQKCYNNKDEKTNDEINHESQINERKLKAEAEEKERQRIAEERKAKAEAEEKERQRKAEEERRLKAEAEEKERQRIAKEERIAEEERQKAAEEEQQKAAEEDSKKRRKERSNKRKEMEESTKKLTDDLIKNIEIIGNTIKYTKTAIEEEKEKLVKDQREKERDENFQKDLDKLKLKNKLYRENMENKQAIRKKSSEIENKIESSVEVIEKLSDVIQANNDSIDEKLEEEQRNLIERQKNKKHEFIKQIWKKIDYTNYGYVFWQNVKHVKNSESDNDTNCYVCGTGSKSASSFLVQASEYLLGNTICNNNCHVEKDAVKGIKFVNNTEEYNNKRRIIIDYLRSVNKSNILNKTDIKEALNIDDNVQRWTTFIEVNYPAQKEIIDQWWEYYNSQEYNPEEEQSATSAKAEEVEEDEKVDKKESKSQAPAEVVEKTTGEKEKLDPLVQEVINSDNRSKYDDQVNSYEDKNNNNNLVLNSIVEQQQYDNTRTILGPIISRPKLSDKLLGKPPFRFIHDIVSNVTKKTGFAEGLFEPYILDSRNVIGKNMKMKYLNKIILFVELMNGKTIDVKASKILSGLEPDNTNRFLQDLGIAAKRYDSEEPNKHEKLIEYIKDQIEEIEDIRQQIKKLEVEQIKAEKAAAEEEAKIKKVNKVLERKQKQKVKKEKKAEEEEAKIKKDKKDKEEKEEKAKKAKKFIEDLKKFLDNDYFQKRIPNVRNENKRGTYLYETYIMKPRETKKVEWNRLTQNVEEKNFNERIFNFLSRKKDIHKFKQKYKKLFINYKNLIDISIKDIDKREGYIPAWHKIIKKINEININFDKISNKNEQIKENKRKIYYVFLFIYYLLNERSGGGKSKKKTKHNKTKKRKSKSKSKSKKQTIKKKIKKIKKK